MWQNKDNSLYRKFEFKDFEEAFLFMQKVAAEAERLNHHPKWQNEWNIVEVWLSTHSESRVTSKDQEFAQIIDDIFTEQEPSEKLKPQQLDEIKLYGDGGSRGNPGPSASGWALLDMKNNVVKKSGIYLGLTTNNQAEYLALKYGLEDALAMQAKTIHVFMDSLLVINQMKGVFKVKNRDLWPIHQSIKDLLPKFNNVIFTHVPRELNKLADSIVNETLDAKVGKRV